MALVLVIDDDKSVAELVGHMVTGFCGHKAIIETDSMEAVVRWAGDPNIRAVLADLMMPHLDGIDILTAWQDNRPDVLRILITAAPGVQAVREAVAAGIVQVIISKPPAILDIQAALRGVF